MPPHLTAPVPPGAARVYSCDSHTVTGLGAPVPPKYDAAGEAMTQNRYSPDGWLTPRPRWVAIRNGRRYRLFPSPPGTQSRSWPTSSSRARTKVSSGSSGMAIRRADRLNRAALASGRNMVIDPLAWRYAFRPSKNSCA